MMARAQESKELTIACLLIPHFPLRVELLRHPELDGAPVALTDLTAHRQTITYSSPEAAALGIQSGMLVREAVSICPEAVILSSDPAYYHDLLATLLAALGRLSPAIEPADLGCVYVDLRGIRRLIGQIDTIITALIGAAPAILRPRLGVAGTKFTALVAAQQAPPGGSRIVPAPEAAAFLAPCPIALLPISAVMRKRLQYFGLTQLGDLARLPRSAIAAQFGAEGGRAWDLANGKGSATLTPVPPTERVSEQLIFPSPTVERDAVMVGLHQLVLRLVARPELRNRGVSQLYAQLLMEGNHSLEARLALKGTTNDPMQLRQRLASRFQDALLPSPVTELRLEGIGLGPVTARQGLLPTLRPRQLGQLAAALQELTQRYGVSPIYRVVEVEPWSRIPERRHALMTFDLSTYRSRSA